MTEEELYELHLLDPVKWVYDMFGVSPTVQQAEVMRALALPGAKVSVRSGHGVGKSGLISWIVLWFLQHYYDVRIPCTAPTSKQLYNVLWAEISKWHHRLPKEYRDNMEVLADRVCIRGQEKVRVAMAITARKDQPEALQGIRSENVLFVIDEASGVADIILQSAEGQLSDPRVRVIMCSNPTRRRGYFFDSHHKDRAEWTCFHFSSRNSPLVPAGYCERMDRKYGKGSPIVKVRVDGEFPPDEPDVLISLEVVLAAVGREILPEGGKVAGLDVARFGDDSNAFVLRHGDVVTGIEQWGGIDLMQTVGKVVAAWKELKFEKIFVDVIGMGGGVVDRLKELGVNVYPVNVAETSAFNGDKFNRLRDELWWKAREWFEGHLCSIELGLELQEDLVGQLTSIKYGLTSAGKIKVEGKDEMKVRGLDSPNLADALNLTFAEGCSISANAGKKKRREVVRRDVAW